MSHNPSRVAGVDIRDIERLSNGLSLNLEEEVVAYVRKHTSRRTGGAVDIFDLLQDVSHMTGASEEDAQEAMDAAYKDHRITVDRNGFVRRVNDTKRRSDATRRVSRVNPDNARVGGLVARLQIPLWVRDLGVWKQALAETNARTSAYWAHVVSKYRMYGGRITQLRQRTADLQPRPFDVHPSVWVVADDGILARDLAVIQEMLAEGSTPQDLENELVEAGAAPEMATELVAEAINTPPLL